MSAHLTNRRLYSLRTPDLGYDWSCWACNHNWRSKTPPTADTPPPGQCPKCKSKTWWWSGAKVQTQPEVEYRAQVPLLVNSRFPESYVLEPPPIAKLLDEKEPAWDVNAYPVYAAPVEPQPENLLELNQPPAQVEPEPAAETATEPAAEPAAAPEPEPLLCHSNFVTETDVIITTVDMWGTDEHGAE